MLSVIPMAATSSSFTGELGLEVDFTEVGETDDGIRVDRMSLRSSGRDTAWLVRARFRDGVCGKLGSN